MNSLINYYLDNHRFSDLYRS